MCKSLAGSKMNLTYAIFHTFLTDAFIDIVPLSMVNHRTCSDDPTGTGSNYFSVTCILRHKESTAGSIKSDFTGSLDIIDDLLVN